MLNMETINSIAAMFKEFFEALLKQDTELVYCRAICKHLANVHLFDLAGKRSLYQVVLEKGNQLVETQKQIGKPIQIVSAGRTAATQNTYWLRGRNDKGEVVDRSKVITDAQGLQSYHNYGLAFDVAFDGFTGTDADWETLGKNGEALGLEWGGRWADTTMGTKGDRPHFQWTDGGRITWAKLKKYIETGTI